MVEAHHHHHQITRSSHSMVEARGRELAVTRKTWLLLVDAVT
jgi:hypothetical protein